MVVGGVWVVVGGRLLVAAVGFWRSGAGVNNLVLRLLVRSGGTTYRPGPCRRGSGARGRGRRRRGCRRWWPWWSRSTRCRRTYLAGGLSSSLSWRCRRCRRNEEPPSGGGCLAWRRLSPPALQEARRGPSASKCANSVRATVHAAQSGANLHLGEPACPAHFFALPLLCIQRASLFFVDWSFFPIHPSASVAKTFLCFWQKY